MFSLERRINAELVCTNLQKYITNINYNTQDHVSILIKLQHNKQTLNVNLECFSYPFKSPIIIVNNIKYNELLQIRNESLRLINFMFSHPQLTSISKQYNWTPCYDLNKIVNEIKYVINIKQKISWYIYAKVIKRTYLNMDIPIEEFL